MTTTTTLYHGSTIVIQRPLVDVGRRHLDFGPGFYLTTLTTQAERWAERMRLIRATDEGWVNAYTFDHSKAADYRSLTFEEYNEEWLTFIIDSRNGGEPWRGYDIITGGVANDRVIDTVEDYLAGVITIAQALGQLAFTKPNNQVCILSQCLADECLIYKESYSI